MAKTINLGKVGLTLEGDYDSSKSYASRTCVFYNHVSWASKKDVPAGIAPGTSEEYWQKVSERGAQGIQGERGPQGNSAFDGNGVEIVNDLTTGGEAAVLSAEQGKILKTELTELKSKNATMGVIELKLFQKDAIVANLKKGEYGYNTSLDVLVEKTGDSDNEYVYYTPTENGIYIFEGEKYRWDGNTLVRWESNSLKRLEQDADKNLVVLPPTLTKTLEGQYVSSLGVLSTNKAFRIKCYITEGVKSIQLDFKTISGSAYAAFAFYSSDEVDDVALLSYKSIANVETGDIYDVPEGAKMVAITEYISASYYNHILAMVRVSEVLSAPSSKMIVSYDNGSLNLTRKYSATQDIVIRFDYCLANDIYHISEIALYHNERELPAYHANHEIADTYIFRGGTDIVGPVEITDIGWIGGNHLLNGSKTAYTESINIKVDGTVLEDGAYKMADVVSINVVNYLYATSGINLIKECVNYQIDQEKVRIKCSHEYLSAFTISSYYGPQSAYKGEVLTPNGEFSNFTIFESDRTFQWSANPLFRQIITRANGVYQSLFLHPSGIGLHPSGYLHSGTKDYFIMQGGVVEEGNIVNWCADYEWFSNCKDNDSIFSYSNTEKLVVCAKDAINDTILIPADFNKGAIRIVGNPINAEVVSNEIKIKTEGAESFLFYNSVSESSIFNAIKKIYVINFDNTREYCLKRLYWDRYNKEFALEISTTESDIIAYSIYTKKPNKTKGIQHIISEDGNVGAWIDFDELYESPSLIIPVEDYDKYKISILPIELPKMYADSEMNMKYSSFMLTAHYYGRIAKKFYLSMFYSYSNKFWVNVFTAETLNKENYSRDANFQLLFNFDDFPQVKAVRSMRELNNGNLLICTYSVSPSYGNVKGFYSEYYIYDVTTKTLTKKFEGNWRRSEDGTYIAAGDAFMTDVWDFSEYDNTIVLSERVGQGVGGKIWYSKDGGNTWYLIFNAQPASNDGAYPIRMPAWDNRFDEGIEGTPTYPNSNFHVHGVTYDHYRNQIIMVSGDATWVQGSYSAIWVLTNPDQCTLYPATSDGIVAEGGTNVDGIPKMLNCSWKRIGLHKNDEGNNVGANLQFVNCVVFKDHLAFGSDCYPNGIYIMTDPANPSLANIRLAYSLDVKDEKDLTHCASACFKEPFSPYLWVFHREESSWDASTSINDRKAYILASDDGINWCRVWEDDTLDKDRNTKISWGAKIIGHAGELLLRYQGFSLDKPSIARHIRLKK